MPDLPYRSAACAACLAAAVVDEIALLKIAGLPIHRDEIAQAAAALRNRRDQGFADRLRQFRIARQADPLRRRLRVDAGLEQAFRRIDIADADHDVACKQHLLDRRAALARLPVQQFRRKRRFQRFRAQPAQQKKIVERASIDLMP